MAQVSPAPTIAVGGNVEGDIIIGDNNFKVNTNNGTIVYKQAAPQVRLRGAVPQPPRAPRGFVNRTNELAQINQLIADSDAATVYGPGGIGKSWLLRQAANGDAARTMPHGVVIIEAVDERGKALGLKDVVQRLFDALFESHPRLKVNLTTARTYLSNTRPLVILEGFNHPPTSLARLPHLLPRGALLIESTRPPSGDMIQEMKLGPLPRVEAIKLLAAQASVTTDDTNRPALNAICAMLADGPLAIVIAANVIRANSIAIDRAREIIASAVPPSTDPAQAGIVRAYTLAYPFLSNDERQILGEAAALPGASVDLELLREITSVVGQVEPAIKRLQMMSLLHTNSPRLRIDPALRTLVRASVDEAAVRDRLVDYLANALKTRSLDWDFCANELGNILGAIRWAGERRRWREVITLGRAIDPYLTLHGLWDAWQTTLNQVLQAAREIGDRVNEGWVLHQSGTLDIGNGQIEQAINSLRQALDLRRSLGDTTGMAYTQHNLDLLIPPPPPSHGEPKPTIKPPPAGIAGALKLLLGIVVIMAVVGGGLILINSLIPPPSVTSTATLTPTPTLGVCPRPSDWIDYVVREGEDLASVATQFNTSVIQLALANCLTSERIAVGQRLFVPRLPFPTATPTNTPTNTPTPTPTPTDTPTATPTATATTAAPPTISSFTADPQTILLGQCVTLAWTTSSAVSPIVLQVNGQMLQSNLPAVGTTSHCPPSTGQQIYSLIITSSPTFGPVSASVVVDVATLTPTPTPTATATAVPPTINSFTANPQTILLGQCVTLAWTTSGAVSPIVLQVNGQTLQSNLPSVGTTSHCPPSTGRQVYSLIITSSPTYGPVSASVIVVVARLTPTPTPTPTPSPTRASPSRLPDLIVQDIGTPTVTCPGGGGTCVTRVSFTVANVGGDAGAFNIRVTLTPSQSVIVKVASLPAGASRTFSITTSPDGNCFDPDCTICVTVDSDKTVIESKEGNNTLCNTGIG